MGHGVDVDGGVVGRGQVEGAICPKGGASQSMTAAWRRQLLRRIVLCEWKEGQVAQSQCGFEEHTLGDHTLVPLSRDTEREKK